MSLDEQYMSRCFQLAKLGMGKVASNPLVGAIIVHNDRIIGEGWHDEYGGAHAEVNAVNSVRKVDQYLLSSATIYVSLEPCFHYGKTPPCVNLILENGFKRVVISCLDIDARVCGKSVSKLQIKGIEVLTGVLQTEGEHLARRFITLRSKKRPYIILKWAQSQDGFLGKEGEQVWLTGKTAKILVHKWRTEESAIMVGTNTALVDNPQLNNRLYPGNSPLRIVLDRKGRLPNNLHLFDGSTPTLYVTEQECDIPNVEILRSSFDENIIPTILNYLYQKDIKSLIVEGGSALLNSFIKKGLWDEARIFTAPVRLGNGVSAPVISVDDQVFIQKIGKDNLEIVLNR
jgi:diaminohydroxyphosphoribosylaminopyrimidine deaminase/5-amino-6-(5-phosphoribosylamino)uracil reductase